MISAKTRLFGVFGHPVGHSRSPDMHNAAFSALSMDCVYLAFDVPPALIKQAVEAVRSLAMGGVNVTVPHKRAVMREMDFLSPEAELAGAVNTIKNENGRLWGHNTDIAGALKALETSTGFTPEGKTALVTGAGGAARAVVSGLCMKNAKRIFIANRTAEKAETLSGEFSEMFEKTELRHCGLNGGEIADFVQDSDIVINCSSAGMEGNAPLALPLEKFGGKFGIYDLVYKPADTPLVMRARELGIKAESGIDMLLYQGAESFRIWTGRDAPVEAMKKALGDGGK